MLNKDLGADPIGELETHRAARVRVGAGGHGGARAAAAASAVRSSAARRRIDRADAEEMARVKEMLRQTMAAPAKITISVDGPLIEIAGDDGTVHRLHADGKKVRDTAATPASSSSARRSGTATCW